MIKKIIQKIFAGLGYQIISKGFDNQKLSNDNRMIGALKRLSKLDILPDLIVDLGAAKGMWTERTLKVWPNSNYLLIEPIMEQITQISPEISDRKGVTIIEAVAGEQKSTVEFTISDDLDGSGVYDGKSGNIRSIKVIPLDSIKEVKNASTVLLKLDTHGYEFPIFEGGSETLKKTDAIIVEVYGFNVSPTGKLFHEVSSYLADKGFRLFDIVDVMRRPDDNAFWQADAIYLKNNNNVFSSDGYK